MPPRLKKLDPDTTRPTVSRLAADQNSLEPSQQQYSRLQPLYSVETVSQHKTITVSSEYDQSNQDLTIQPLVQVVQRQSSSSFRKCGFLTPTTDEKGSNISTHALDQSLNSHNGSFISKKFSYIPNTHLANSHSSSQSLHSPQTTQFPTDSSITIPVDSPSPTPPALPTQIHPHSLYRNHAQLDVLARELPYTIFKAYQALEHVIKQENRNSMFQFGPCVIYLVAFIARIVHENKSWFGQNVPCDFFAQNNDSDSISSKPVKSVKSVKSTKPAQNSQTQNITSDLKDSFKTFYTVQSIQQLTQDNPSLDETSILASLSLLPAPSPSLNDSPDRSKKTPPTPSPSTTTAPPLGQIIPLAPVYTEVIRWVTNIGNLWRTNAPFKRGKPADVDICEGARGIYTTPGMVVDNDMFNSVKKAQNMIEWDNRDSYFDGVTKMSKAMRWSDVTKITTLQWNIDKDSITFFRWCVIKVCLYMDPIVQTWEKPKEKGKNSSGLSLAPKSSKGGSKGGTKGKDKFEEIKFDGDDDGCGVLNGLTIVANLPIQRENNFGVCSNRTGQGVTQVILNDGKISSPNKIQTKQIGRKIAQTISSESKNLLAPYFSPVDKKKPTKFPVNSPFTSPSKLKAALNNSNTSGDESAGVFLMTPKKKRLANGVDGATGTQSPTRVITTPQKTPQMDNKRLLLSQKALSPRKDFTAMPTTPLSKKAFQIGQDGGEKKGIVKKTNVVLSPPDLKYIRMTRKQAQLYGLEPLLLDAPSVSVGTKPPRGKANKKIVKHELQAIDEAQQGEDAIPKTTKMTDEKIPLFSLEDCPPIDPPLVSLKEGFDHLADHLPSSSHPVIQSSQSVNTLNFIPSSSAEPDHNYDPAILSLLTHLPYPKTTSPLEKPYKTHSFPLINPLFDYLEPTYNSFSPAFSKLNTLTIPHESLIYCVTHLILVASEFGSRPFLYGKQCTISEMEYLTSMLSSWLLYISQGFPSAHALNRELVTEIVCCLYISKHNGILLTPAVLRAMRLTVDICLVDYYQRWLVPLSNVVHGGDPVVSQNSPLKAKIAEKLRLGPANLKECTYIPIISMNQDKDSDACLFAQYHTHFLIGLLYAFAVVDTYGGVGYGNYPTMEYGLGDNREEKDVKGKVVVGTNGKNKNKSGEDVGQNGEKSIISPFSCTDESILDKSEQHRWLYHPIDQQYGEYLEFMKCYEELIAAKDDDKSGTKFFKLFLQNNQNANNVNFWLLKRDQSKLQSALMKHPSKTKFTNLDTTTFDQGYKYIYQQSFYNAFEDSSEQNNTQSGQNNSKDNENSPQNLRQLSSLPPSELCGCPMCTYQIYVIPHDRVKECLTLCSLINEEKTAQYQARIFSHHSPQNNPHNTPPEALYSSIPSILDSLDSLYLTIPPAESNNFTPAANPFGLLDPKLDNKVHLWSQSQFDILSRYKLWTEIGQNGPGQTQLPLKKSNVESRQRLFDEFSDECTDDGNGKGVNSVQEDGSNVGKTQGGRGGDDQIRVGPRHLDSKKGSGNKGDYTQDEILASFYRENYYVQFEPELVSELGFAQAAKKNKK